MSDKQGTVGTILSAVSAAISGAGYAETLQTFYLILSIISICASLLYWGLVIFLKIKKAFEDKKLSDQEIKDITDTAKAGVADVTAKVDDTKKQNSDK